MLLGADGTAAPLPDGLHPSLTHTWEPPETEPDWLLGVYSARFWPDSGGRVVTKSGGTIRGFGGLV